jgi:predicted amidohydrolase
MKLTLGYLQFHPTLGDPARNRRRMAELLALHRADLVVLPELSTSGYCLGPEAMRAVAEPADGPTAAAFVELARRTGTHYIVGLPELAGGRLFNCIILVGPRGVLASYRKVHLFGFEPGVFTPGDGEPEPVDFGGTRLGLMICFDWIYPEVARVLALHGATVLCHPSNLVLPHCPDAMITRCLENRVFAVTANRVGEEDWRGEAVRFIGMSQVVTPSGEVLGRAGEDEEGVFLVDVDTSLAEDKVVRGNDIFAMRRPRLYRGLCE